MKKSPDFIDAVYPDSVRPRADRNLQKRRQHALRLLPLVQQQHPRFGRPAQGRHAVPAGGRKKRHPHAGRRPLVQGRPLLLQQRTGFSQGVDSPRAGLRTRKRAADLLFFHLVAAYSLLHETRAIHAGAVRAGTLHGAGRTGRLQARHRRSLQAVRPHLPDPRTQGDRRRLLPQGDRLHRREQPQQILAAYSLFRAGHRPHRHRTVRRSRRRARKRQGAAHPARIHLAAESQTGDPLQPDRPERRSPHAVRPDPAGTRRIPYDGQPHRSAACHQPHSTN